MLIPIEDKVILRFLSISISILAVLISTIYALAESRSVPVVSVIRKEVPIPKKSMERLLEIGRSISKENGLEIKRINLEVWYHPIDTLIAVIEFKERFLKDDVYEYVYQPFTNKNWIRGNINRAYYQSEKIKPHQSNGPKKAI